jgi:hypothetical protein
MLILGEGHLRSAMTEYVDHYNRARPHRGLGLDVPLRSSTRDRPRTRDSLLSARRSHPRVFTNRGIATPARPLRLSRRPSTARCASNRISTALHIRSVGAGHDGKSVLEMPPKPSRLMTTLARRPLTPQQSFDTRQAASRRGTQPLLLCHSWGQLNHSAWHQRLDPVYPRSRSQEESQTRVGVPLLLKDDPGQRPGPPREETSTEHDPPVVDRPLDRSGRAAGRSGLAGRGRRVPAGAGQVPAQRFLRRLPTSWRAVGSDGPGVGS